MKQTQQRSTKKTEPLLNSTDRQSLISFIAEIPEENFKNPFWTDKLAFFGLCTFRSAPKLAQLSESVDLEQLFRKLIERIRFDYNRKRTSIPDKLDQHNLAQRLRINANGLGGKAE